MKKILFTEDFLVENYAESRYSQLPVQPYELEDFGENVENGLLVPVYEYEELQGKTRAAARRNVIAYAAELGMGRDVRTEQEFAREVQGAMFFENGALLDKAMMDYVRSL